MARTFTGKGEFQRDFIKIFDSLTGRFNRWEVWKDIVWCIAIAISNRVDERFRDSREKTYMDIVSKYSEQEVNKIADLFGILHKNIIDKTENGNYGDFLGEIFMELGLGNDAGGQFFTPYNICQLMARVTLDADMERAQQAIEKQGYMTCMDCACGAGATLIGAAEACVEKGINYPFQVMFAAQDIDTTTALMCYIQLSLLGCAGYVVIGNTLSEPMTGHVLFGENSERCWYTPMYFEESWHQRREIEIARMKFRTIMGYFDNAATTKNDAQQDEDADDSLPDAGEQMLDLMGAPIPVQTAKEISPRTERKTAKKRREQMDGQITFQF